MLGFVHGRHRHDLLLHRHLSATRAALLPCPRPPYAPWAARARPPLRCHPVASTLRRRCACGGSSAAFQDRCRRGAPSSHGPAVPNGRWVLAKRRSAPPPASLSMIGQPLEQFFEVAHTDRARPAALLRSDELLPHSECHESRCTCISTRFKYGCCKTQTVLQLLHTVQSILEALLGKGGSLQKLAQRRVGQQLTFVIKNISSCGTSLSAIASPTCRCCSAIQEGVSIPTKCQPHTMMFEIPLKMRGIRTPFAISTNSAGFDGLTGPRAV